MIAVFDASTKSTLRPFIGALALTGGHYVPLKMLLNFEPTPYMFLCFKLLDSGRIIVYSFFHHERLS